MLPRPNRMRRSEDFRRTVRRGVRIGRPTLVLHATYLPTRTTPLDPRRVHKNTRTRASAPNADRVRVGFVVGKAVGNAVTRNRVRRRLRHLAAAQLPGTPAATEVVVRALPGAATTPAEVPADFSSAWSQALARLGAPAPEAAGAS